ncbi:MAG: hypothetical protein HFJ52_02075 [Clostridia bacterium]|nr:hypothetical protein [Clostridia bacterium]
MSGEITKEEIERKRAERAEREKQEKKQNDPNRKKILQGLNEGKTNEEMTEDVTIGVAMIKRIVADLVSSGEITREEIRKKREERKRRLETEKKDEPKNTQSSEASRESISVNEPLKQETLTLLLLGISTIQIQDMLHITHNTFEIIVEELTKKGQITLEQIQEARTRRDKESKDIVYELYMLGYTYEEIADKIPCANESYVRNIVNKLKAEGKITKEKENIAREEKKVRERILKGLMKGLTSLEIVDSISNKELTEQEVEEYTKRFIEEGTISNKDLQEAREEREKNNKENLNQDSKEEYEDEILTLFNLGFDGQTISNITKLSRGYVRKIKNILIAKGKTTKEQIKDNIKNRNKSTRSRRRNINAMIAFEKNIDISEIQKHIEYTKATIALKELEPKDMDQISMAIPMNHDLMTLRNINFVIQHYNDTECLEFAVDFINRCLESARDSQEEKRLMEMKAKIERKMERQKESRYSKRNRWVSESIRANPRIIVKLPEDPTPTSELKQEER